jgi:hypothetical protein
VTVKSEFRKEIRFILIGLGLAMFCLGCATTPPKPEEPAPISRVESPVVQEETPAPTSIPAPAPPPKIEPVPQKPPLVVQEPPPSSPSSSLPPPPPPVKEAQPQPALYLHTVKYRGETLSIIALWYTGNHDSWKKIAQGNPDLDPNRIFPGDEILIPEGMLKTHDPLPKEFVDRIYSKASKEKGQPRARTQAIDPQQEDLKLFGPRKTTRK